MLRSVGSRGRRASTRSRERSAGRCPVGADVGLEATQQGAVVGCDRVVDVGGGMRSGDELQLAGVATPGGEQRVLRERGGAVVAAPWQRSASSGLDVLGDGLPQDG